MGALRRALGNTRDVIKTIPGRGYLLAENVEPGEGEVMGEEKDRHLVTDPSSEGQRAIFAALFNLLEVVDRHPSALSSVEALLTARRPPTSHDVQQIHPARSAA